MNIIRKIKQEIINGIKIDRDHLILGDMKKEIIITLVILVKSIMQIIIRTIVTVILTLTSLIERKRKHSFSLKF